MRIIALKVLNGVDPNFVGLQMYISEILSYIYEMQNYGIIFFWKKILLVMSF